MDAAAAARKAAERRNGFAAAKFARSARAMVYA